MENQIAGIYLHVPFCRAKCGYCAFNSVPLPDEATLSRYADCLERELLRRAPLLAAGHPQTIYFGGGTPSLLPPERIAALIERIKSLVAPDASPAEITLEANPATLTEKNLAGFRRAGVDRLSIGAQTFDPAALLFLQTTFRAGHVERAFDQARQAGFDNISLDLIVGLPEPYTDVYRKDLQRLLDLGPEHISVYQLTFESPSCLAQKRDSGEISPLNDDRQADIFLDCHKRLTAAGYRHYEVSNYAVPGRQSRHNSLYWTGESYLGLGAGAHSLLQENGLPVRRANAEEPDVYRCLLETDRDPCNHTETLLPAVAAREKVMLALRTSEGLAPRDFDQAQKPLGNKLQAHLQAGHFTWDGERFRPTPAGLLLADAIALELWDLWLE